MPKAALFDFDNTLYKGHSYFDIVAYQIDTGILPASLEQQNKEVVDYYKKGDSSYETTLIALLENYAAALAGRSYAVVSDSVATFFQQNGDKIYDFARPLVDLLRPTHTTLLVTGSPQFVAANAADMLGLHGYLSTVFEVTDGTFTGRVASHLAYDYEKGDAVRAFLPGLQTKGSFAFGDSEGDKAMLAMVEHAVCLNPTPGLAQVAAKNQWPIDTPATVEQLVRSML